MTVYSSILAWKIPCTEEPGGLQSMGSQRVHNTSQSDTTNTFTFSFNKVLPVFRQVLFIVFKCIFNVIILFLSNKVLPVKTLQYLYFLNMQRVGIIVSFSEAPYLLLSLGLCMCCSLYLEDFLPPSSCPHLPEYFFLLIVRICLRCYFSRKPSWPPWVQQVPAVPFNTLQYSPGFPYFPCQNPH